MFALARNSISLVKPFMQFSTGRSKLLALNDLHYVPGSRKTRKRVGRGVGSGMGKTSTHGHQFSRSTPRQFEGGQTPYWKTIPKSGFTNSGARKMSYLNINTINQFIQEGKFKLPKENELITMRDLLGAGLVSNLKDGLKLLGDPVLLENGFKHRLNLEVSMASKSAIKIIEKAGGTVTTVHFNRLSLRALAQPYKFSILPLRARPSPNLMGYYLDKSVCGYLSPEIQMRNMKLFGYVTSEDKLRVEHAMFMRANVLLDAEEAASDNSIAKDAASV